MVPHRAPLLAIVVEGYRDDSVDRDANGTASFVDAHRLKSASGRIRDQIFTRSDKMKAGVLADVGSAAISGPIGDVVVVQVAVGVLLEESIARRERWGEDRFAMLSSRIEEDDVQAILLVLRTDGELEQEVRR